MQEPPQTGISGQQFLRRFRASYTNIYRQRQAFEGAEPGGEVKTPAESPISVEQLPKAARSQLEAYRRAHPDKEIEFIKYMRTVNGRSEIVVEDERGLPDEAQLLVLSSTVTLTSADSMQVITELFVARSQ